MNLQTFNFRVKDYTKRLVRITLSAVNCIDIDRFQGFIRGLLRVWQTRRIGRHALERRKKDRFHWLQIESANNSQYER